VLEAIEAKGFQDDWSDICGNGRRYESPTEYFNGLEGVVIEAALQDDISPPATGRVDGPVFSDQTVRLIKAKHYWQHQLATIPDGARWVRAQFHLHFNEAAKLATAAIRSEKRQRAAALADEAERAAGQRNLRRLHTIVNKLAPKPAAPIMTAKDLHTGLPRFDAEDDQRVRIQSICDVCDGAAMSVDERSLQAGRKERDDDRISSYGLAEVKESTMDLPNLKRGLMLQWPMRGPPGGAVAEPWKLASDTLAPPLLQVSNAAQALGDAPQRFKDGETMQLRKPKGDGCTASTGYRTISLINHVGKACAKVATLDAMREALGGSQLKFFDDLLTFVGIGEYDDASIILEVLTGEIKAGGMRVNGGKTEILLTPSEVSSKKRLKHIRAQTTGIVTWGDDDYFPLHPQPTVKYLRVQLAATGTRHVEVANRIRAASSTHARLLRRAFKSGPSAKLKIRLWKVLVRSVCLRCVEVAHLAKRGLNKLESWQVKKLRGLLNLPAHLYKNTSRESRKWARAPNATSTLLLRKLRWWQQVLWPAFKEPSDDLHDPTLAVRAVIFGRFSFERVGHRGQSGTLTLLLDDMRQMWQTADAQGKLTARRLLQLRGDLPELAEPRLRWLAALEPRCLRRVLTHGGE
ncbi:unnamed protein product, partial [Prorocentrum cordatum]